MEHPPEHVHQLVSHLFRHEAGKMAAVLTRLLGTHRLEVVEDIVQDSLMKAMETWRYGEIPDNPSAWLYKVARNKAIDWLRSEQRKVKLHSSEENNFKSIQNLSADEELFNEEIIQDSVLRMMFACCHPAIPPESQIALTLKTLGGLSVPEIADSFLVSEETIAKRIYRAKEKIKQENIQLEPPGLFEVSHRLSSVLQVLYLMFNEGYYSTHGNSLIREDLCEEAMRLTYLLVQHPTLNLPKVNALMALMCLQSSRFGARTGTDGEIVLLEFQDRGKWNQPLIRQGLHFLEMASTGTTLSEYLIEASIASVHALASKFEETRWEKLVELYQTLDELKPGPMVRLNLAIAVGYAQSPERGIEELKKINGLENHRHYQTALGNFHALLNKKTEARFHFEVALKNNPTASEAALIERKIKGCR